MGKVKISFIFKKANSSKGGIDDKLIAWWTKGLYSHVEIVYEDKYGRSVMTSAVPYNIFLNGKVRTIEHKYDKESYDYLDLYITNKEFETIIGFLKSVEGSDYDKLGILGFVLPSQDRSDKWFCSELCSNCLKIIGFEPMWALDSSNISPNKLYNLIKSYPHTSSEKNKRRQECHCNGI